MIGVTAKEAETWRPWAMAYIDIGLAQPGLPGGAFGASLQGPGEEVVIGPAVGITSLRGPHIPPFFVSC